MRHPTLGLFLAMGLCACSAANGDKGDDSLLPHSDGGPRGTSDSDPGFATDSDPGGAMFDAKPGTPLDPTKDNDGDGYLYADDCDDKNPDVNPGAYEVLGDKVDNDCDGKIDNEEICDTPTLALTSSNGLDFAKALNLCRTTTAAATGKAKTWGVISAELVHADGSGGVDPLQHGLFTNFGSAVKPRQGANMVALSSGTARTPGQSGYVMPLTPSYKTSSEVTPPAGWPKNTAGCPGPKTNTANDSMNLKLTIRVPTNASGFKYSFNFYSSEYIEYVCSEFNDTFVAILNSKAPIDPKYAGNISFDSKGNPVNVNSGFFEVCTPGSKSGHSFPCAKGTGELSNTGFWFDIDPRMNGATSWLETKAPAVPGEIITLQFMIWDTGDHILDSTVLLDDFQWAAKGTTPSAPVTDRPK